MANPNTNTFVSLPNEAQIFYDKHLLKVAEPLCAYRRHASKTSVPKNSGKIVNWRDFKKFDVNPVALTEGVVPDGMKFNIDKLEAEIKFYGAYAETTDQLQLLSIDDTIMAANKRLGIHAAETLDYLAGTEFTSGTSAFYAGGKESRGALDTTSTIAVEDIIKASQILKANSAPTIDGSYFCIIHPHVVYDLMTYLNDKGNNPFIDISKYVEKENIVKGEIGKLFGIRFIETPNAITTTQDGTSNGMPVYKTLIYGGDALGCVDLAGGNLRTIVKALGSAGTADPLDMKATIGWKAADACKILNQDNLIRIESASTMAIQN